MSELTHFDAQGKARTVGQESIDLAQVVADPEALKLVPQDFARRHRLLPIAYDSEERQLSIATTEIFNVVVMDQLRALVGANVDIRSQIAAEAQVEEYIDRFYGYELSVDGILKEIETGEIDCDVPLARDIGREVKRKAEGVIKTEHGVAVEHLVFGLQRAFEHGHAVLQRFGEAFLFLLQHMRHAFGRLRQFRICDTHRLDEVRHDFVEEGFDLAIRHTERAPDTHVAWTLCPTASVLVATRTYLRRMGAPKVPADLQAHNCLHYPRSQETPVWTLQPRERKRGQERVSVPVSGAFSANNSEALREAALSGAGIAMRWPGKYRL